MGGGAGALGLMISHHRPRFRQRIFLAQLRGGKPFQVGLPPQHVSIREARDSNGSLWSRLSQFVFLWNSVKTSLADRCAEGLQGGGDAFGLGAAPLGEVLLAAATAVH